MSTEGRFNDKSRPFTKDDRNSIEFFGQDASKVQQKAEKIREFRREASRLAAIANKRIKRLEDNNLTETPAYKSYIEMGAKKFSVKGKDYNQVQQELSKLRKFIDAKTSTVRGANNVLKDIAKNTGIKYKNMKELREKSSKFFELASKVEQYLRNVEDIASAIGYQEIWTAINTYTDEAKADLANGEADLDAMVERVTKALTEYETPTPFIGGWYSLKKSDVSNNNE